MKLRAAASAVVLFAASVMPLAAQTSVFGVHGIGFPGKPYGVRSRGMGGGGAIFDARSALNPATVVGMPRLVVTASFGTTMSGYTAQDSVVNGLTETRFPFAMLGGRIRRTPLAFALSYATYADRTYDRAMLDSVTIRGETVEVNDRIASDGSVADIRGALAMRVLRWLNVGAAVHVVSGSARLTQHRTFSDSVYRTLYESNRVGLQGMGLSAGATAALLPGLSVAVAYRTDTRLEATLDSTPAGGVELPRSVTAGLAVAPYGAVTLSTTVSWHSWSDAAGDLEAVGGANAFDTWEVGTGIEIGGGAARSPLRFGVRYAELPFSPHEQAREIALAAGTALRFAGDRATIDCSIERVSRKGAGAEERAWYLAFALTIMP